MTPTLFEQNIRVVRFMYQRAMCRLFFNRWLVTIVSSLSLILIVQDLYNYHETETLPAPNNYIVLGLSLAVLLYSLRRIKILSVASNQIMHDLAKLSAYLEMKNVQINEKCDGIDSFVDKIGNDLNTDIRERYGINS